MSLVKEMKRLNYSIHIAGDQSVLITFGEEINEQTNRYVRHLASAIEKHNIFGVSETILGYTNLLVYYDPFLISYNQLKSELIRLIDHTHFQDDKRREIIEIPVLYGFQGGPDLKDVAHLNELTEEDVIKIHTKPIYTVYFLGFSPGFPFLGGMSERIVTPRLANPRTKIQAGSVGIANNQTGIYPVSSPGGWRLIGHTPTLLYDQSKQWPFLLSPGDRLKFKSITKNEYDKLIDKSKLSIS